MAQRILCIESDLPFRARVRRLLEDSGFTVDEASSGLAGIQRALTLPPDLVIADVHLPDIDGVEIATRLKQERSLAKVPFLALGDADDEHDVALAAGADAFLAKPVDDERLGAEVRAVLGVPEREEGHLGERALLLQAAGDLDAVDVGQVDVGDDEIGRQREGPLDPGEPGRRLVDREARVLEQAPDARAKREIALDAEDALGHGGLRAGG